MLIDAVAGVGREASRRAGEIEALRRLPDDLAGALIDTGVFKACVPACYGGGEVAMTELLAALEELAYHDGSTAWCAMIGATTGLTAAFLPADHAARIYGDPRAATAGYALPAAKGRVVDGGLVVSGRWSWGSATQHCTWIGGGCFVVDDAGERVALADGTRAPFVFFERDQVELLDTWRVAGLRGTGSTDYAVTEQFVPEGRWVQPGQTAAVVDVPAARFPFLGALALGVCSVGVGLARRALDELVGLAAGKRPVQSERTLAERPVVQMQVAQAEAAWRSARAFVREVVDEAWHEAAAGRSLSTEHKRALRLAATNAAWRSADAVDLAYHAAGGSSIHEASPLQRVFRDVHVLTQHGMIAERTFEPLGRLALGLPTDASQL